MSLSHSPLIVRDGLVLCLDAANPRSYPKSGTTWSDLAGSNDGAMQNMTGSSGFNTDNRGNIVFDGSDDIVVLQQGQIPIGTQERSCAIWFRMSSDANAAILNWGGNSSDGTRWNLWRTKDVISGQKIGIECTNVYKLVDWSFDINWHQLVVTMDSSATLNGSTIYFDGTERQVTASANTSTTINTASTDFVIGRLSGTSIQYFPGGISQISIYNRALTAEEVQQNYRATKGRFK